jgi:hypothetical protein
MAIPNLPPLRCALDRLPELSAASLRSAARLGDAALEANLATAVATALAIGATGDGAAEELARLRDWRAAVASKSVGASNGFVDSLKIKANYGDAFFNYRAALEGVPIGARSRLLLCCAKAAPAVFALSCLASCRDLAASFTVMCLEPECDFPLEQLRSSAQAAPLPADASTGEWTARLLSHAQATPCASTGAKRPKNDGVVLERADSLAAFVSVAPYLATGGWLILPAGVMGRQPGDAVATLHALFKTVVFAPMAGGGGLLICREFAGVRKSAVPAAKSNVDRGLPIVAANAEYVRAFAASCVKSNIVTAAVLRDSPLAGGSRCVGAGAQAASPALSAWRRTQAAAVGRERAARGGSRGGRGRPGGRY